MSNTLGWDDVALRLALAVLVGAVFGLNRSGHGHEAGLRTTLLVCVAAALAMLQANWILAAMQGSWNSVFRLDLMRLPLGILSGMGFIGAGAIIRRGELVRGLTTAATLWIVTVIGLCLGGGQIGLGLAGAAIGYVALSVLGWAEGFIPQERRGTLTVAANADGPSENAVRGMLRAAGLRVESFRLTHWLDPEPRHQIEYEVKYRRGDGVDAALRLVDDLVGRPGVASVNWHCFEV
jgi:putative Mg2+ transporter-C (MgtC) family protein